MRPFTISIAGSTPEGKGLHLDLCLTDIFVVVNPKTIELLSKCYFALYAIPSEDIESTQKIDYADLWEMKRFEENDYWFLMTGE